MSNTVIPDSKGKTGGVLIRQLGKAGSPTWAVGGQLSETRQCAGNDLQQAAI